MFFVPTKTLLLFLVLSLFQFSAIAQETQCSFSNTKDIVTQLPKFGDVEECQVAGVLPIRSHQDPYQDFANLFYWFVASENDPKNAPLILWFNGGPGASGFYGFFAENGPYEIQPDGTLRERPFSWSKRANYLIIEQAPGVGLSYSGPDFHLSDEMQAIDFLYFALTEFYKKYPELIHNSLYIAGQSYGGKYIPELATKIYSQKSFSIPLKGIIIINGWVDPLTQLSVKSDFAYSHGLIDLKTKHLLNEKFLTYKNDLLEGKPSAQNISLFCEDVQKIIDEKSGLCKTNIRITKEPDYRTIATYLNQGDVQKTLHVDPRVHETILSSDSISKAFSLEVKNSVVPLYNDLLNNEIKVLIISGLDDGSDCNFMGTDLWLGDLKWKNAEAFNQAPTTIIRAKNQDVVGYMQKANNLTYVKIRGAGHLAPMDQPENVRNVVYDFIFEQQRSSESMK